MGDGNHLSFIFNHILQYTIISAVVYTYNQRKFTKRNQNLLIFMIQGYRL